MKIQTRFLVRLTILLSSVTCLACNRTPEKPPVTQTSPATQFVHVVQGEDSTDKSKQNEYQGNPHDPEKKGSLVATITFVIKNPDLAEEGPSPYVSIEHPGKDIQFMEKAGDIVVPNNLLYVVVDYPVSNQWEFKVTSANPKGFTKAELVNEISRVFHSMYLEEARTTEVPVVPKAERKTLRNRNRTNGKYGIWGHDIDDLVLHTVELHKAGDGKLYAKLGIDS
jgi:hypothetical protein